MAKKNLAQVYVRPEDKVLLEKMQHLESRGAAPDQLSVIIREACERRGIDVERVLAEAKNDAAIDAA